MRCNRSAYYVFRQHCAVRYVLAPPFWRRRFGAAVLAPAVLAPDTLAPRKGAGHFGAEEGRRTLWRRGRAPDTLAPRAGASNTIIRPPSQKNGYPPKNDFLDVSCDFRGGNIFFGEKSFWNFSNKFISNFFFRGNLTSSRGGLFARFEKVRLASGRSAPAWLT